MKKKRTPAKNAVALHYDGKNAPRITAKGRGSVAEEIIALAAQHGVPLHEDRSLVELLAQLELNDTIPRELYLAVAEVIAFAYRVTERFPPGWSASGRQDEPS
jgi:flagellar biosynthesis protein